MKVFLTGGIGSGKSTAVRAALALLGWERPAGFFTHWNGAERGAASLYAETWAGAKHPMARRAARLVGPGGLNYELEPGFAEFALAALAGPDPAAPLVVDELGLIELAAPPFVEAVALRIRGSAPVLAVVQARAVAHWRPWLDPAGDARWFDVAAPTRSALPGRIAAGFRG